LEEVRERRPKEQHTQKRKKNKQESPAEASVSGKAKAGLQSECRMFFAEERGQRERENACTC
jgi:hypothetical protein